MSKRLQLSINDPCHEKWDNMTPSEKGRFCDSCQKQVVDFTVMSDSQLAAFFKKPSTGSVCGRFYEDQLERDIEIPKKRIPWVKYFFQIALPAFLVSMKATAQGNVMPKVVYPADSIPKPDCKVLTGDVEREEVRTLMGDTILIKAPGQERVINPLQHLPGITKGRPGTDLVSINGKVVGEDSNPIPGASIFIKGTKIGTMADTAGVFKLENVQAGEEVILQVSSVGYNSSEVRITDRMASNQVLLVQLKGMVMGEVVVVGYPSRVGRVVLAGGISVMKSEKRDIPVTKPPAELPAMIKVYPNPVQSGSSINIGCQKLKEGYYYIQLSNQSGQQLLNQQAWVDAGMQVLNIDLPHVASGVYFLRLVSKENNKRFTQKVIIE